MDYNFKFQLSQISQLISIIILSLLVSQSSSKVTNNNLTIPSIYLSTAGGLGNQLFEYACSYSLARHNNWPLYIHLPNYLTNSFLTSSRQNISQRHYQPKDRSFALHYFKNIPLQDSKGIDQFVLENPKFVAKLSDKEILNGTYPKNKILKVDDYCQSVNFFFPYRNEIRNLFSLEIDTQPVKKWEKVISLAKESVSVHIRRGDFSSLKYRLVDILFYLEAMTNIARRLKQAKNSTKPTFFIFSDDIQFVKKELTHANLFTLEEKEKTFELHWVSNPNSLSNIEEFYLMSKCRHNIMSGSSFGWWAAYLNPYKNKIIIASHYNPNLFASDSYHKLQYRNIYYPFNWTIVDPKFID